MVQSTKTRAPRKLQDKKTFNAKGYAKRYSLKAKKQLTNRSLSDIYEYQQGKERRGKVELLLEKDEMLGGHEGTWSDEDEEEDNGERKGRGPNVRPRLVGEDDGDAEINEDEDEEIDSDEAFEESDEERFAGFGFASQKNKAEKIKSALPVKKTTRTPPSKSVRFAEVDLDENDDKGDEENGGTPRTKSGAKMEEDDEGESEEEEGEGDSDEFINILDIMDGKGEALSDENEGEVEMKQEHDPPRPGVASDGNHTEDEESEGHSKESDEEEEIDEEVDIVSASEDEDDTTASNVDQLRSFIASLDTGHKRRHSEDEPSSVDGVEPRPQRRRLLQELTQSGVENEFTAHAGSNKLNLDDLLAPLTSASTSSNLQSLKKSTKILASTSSKHKTLSAPLPTRTQECLDRAAAYEQTKEEVDKWNVTMKQIKEAEHLSFPLQAPTAERPSNLQLAATFKPMTDMESAVDKLMKAANLREQDIAHTESLKLNHLSAEEVAARRAELAKKRELMFRAEAKAKRIAKIKSKTYRRLKKKERSKLAEKLGEGDLEDHDEEERMKKEMERARERATLKHKNTGKWAKAMKHRGELDEDQRRDITEMLDRGELLRRKVHGQESGEESEDDDDGGVSDEDEETIKARAFDELASLQREDESVPEEQKDKGVFEMKFMKDAVARDRQRAKILVDDFVKELGGRLPNEDEDENASELPNLHGASVERVGGRVVYRPGAISEGMRPIHSLASDTSSVTLKSTDLLPTDPAHLNSATVSPISPISERHIPLPAEKPNPWLVPRQEGVISVKAVQKRHEVSVSKNSASAEKSKNRLKKMKQNLEEEREKAKEDAFVDISMADVLSLSAVDRTAAPTGKGKSSFKGKSKAADASARGATTQSDDSDSDANSELDEQEKLVDAKLKGKAGAVKAFEQRDLVARAFAGDNVVQEFAEAKRQEMQEDAPKEVDTTLSGWGSWGGLGARKAPPKPHLVKKIAGVDPTSRADYNKAHVIISEKRDKKAAKYLVKDLPFPYTSKAQFERSMNTPLGTEWNTRVGFQRGTLPKVVMKPGTIISPLEKLL